ADLAVVSTAAPTILTQPASRFVNLGDDAVFSVITRGAPLPACQWSKNGVAISGATGPTLTIPAAQLADAGNFSVVVTNTYGNATSNVVSLTVVQPAVISVRPLSKMALV